MERIAIREHHIGLHIVVRCAVGGRDSAPERVPPFPRLTTSTDTAAGLKWIETGRIRTTQGLLIG